MFILKHLIKTLTCFDFIQIIFRELVCSLIKLLILKFVINCISQCGDAAVHLVCVRAFCVKMCADTHLHAENTTTMICNARKTNKQYPYYTSHILTWFITTFGRSRQPRGLRRGSTAARLLRLWVRIPPGGMDVCLL